MTTEDLPQRFNDLPPHASRKRYRQIGCRCVACTRGPKSENLPTELRWPYRWLDRVAHEQVVARYPKELINQWKTEGLDDFEADRVCIALGLLPHTVFPGYVEAGMDCEVYP